MNEDEALTSAGGPMSGIKVLDIGTMIAAPLAGGVLADQGAEVIKVETPGLGDLMRYVGANCNGVGAMYQNVNRGKRSIALNLKTQEGIEVLHRLVKQVDVIIHNFRPGVAERLQADYATLAALNPQLVYLSVTGFGHEGPMSKKAAYDNVVQTFAGVAMSQTDPRVGEPSQYQQLFADKLTAHTACQAITAALFARERGAGGQHVQLAMADAVASFLWMDKAGTAQFKSADATLGLQASADPRLIKFRNGYAQAAPVSDSDFHGWCAAFGVDSSDPRVATLVDRASNNEAVVEISNRILENALELDVDETLARLEAADVPCAKAHSLEELPAHPQMQANGLFVETEHPLAGPMVEPQNPAHFSKTPSGCGAPSPVLGAHTDVILAELGYEGEVIAQLRARSVVA